MFVSAARSGVNTLQIQKHTLVFEDAHRSVLTTVGAAASV